MAIYDELKAEAESILMEFGADMSVTQTASNGVVTPFTVRAVRVGKAVSVDPNGVPYNGSAYICSAHPDLPFKIGNRVLFDGSSEVVKSATALKPTSLTIIWEIETALG